MPLDFPTSPSLNDVYTYESRSWIWDGSGWKVYGSQPRFLPVKDYAGSIVQVGLAFLYLPVKNYSGATVNVIIN